MTTPPPAEPERSDQPEQPGRHGPLTLGAELAPERAAAWRAAAELTRAALRDPERARARP